jgi:hypothetical protein
VFAMLVEEKSKNHQEIRTLSENLHRQQSRSLVLYMTF